MTFCYTLPVEHPFEVSSNNQSTYCYSIGIGTAFPWWKYHSEISIRTHCSLS